MYTVLYLDDDEGLLGIGKRFLEKDQDFSVYILDKPASALYLLEKRNFDAIISDYQMPDMDGIAFLKAVRGQDSDTPFILFTGRGREEVVIEAINNGADFYLQKGGEPNAQFAELRHKVRQAIARRKAQDQLQDAYKLLRASDTELREQYRQLALREQQLRDREKKFRAIFEKTHDALILFTREGCIDCNQQAVALFGYTSREELFGLKPADTAPPVQPDGRDSGEAAEARMQSVLEQGTVNFEWIQKRKDGSIFPAEILLSAFELDGETVFMSSIRDISDRRQAEELYHTLVTHVRDGVFLIQDGIVLHANQIVLSMLGYPEPQDGMPLSAFIAPEDRAMAERLQDEIIGGENPEDSFCLRLLHHDGTTRIPGLFSAGTGTYNGRPAIIATVRDLMEKAVNDPATIPGCREGTGSS